jgi:hypothetical protein
VVHCRLRRLLLRRAGGAAPRGRPRRVAREGGSHVIGERLARLDGGGEQELDDRAPPRARAQRRQHLLLQRHRPARERPSRRVAHAVHHQHDLPPPVRAPALLPGRRPGRHRPHHRIRERARAPPAQARRALAPREQAAQRARARRARARHVRVARVRGVCGAAAACARAHVGGQVGEHRLLPRLWRRSAALAAAKQERRRAAARARGGCREPRRGGRAVEGAGD